MASEYDLYHHPQLNPLIQQKLATSILRVSRICWKLCYKDTDISPDCIENCTENYIKSFDIVLDEIQKRNRLKKS